MRCFADPGRAGRDRLVVAYQAVQRAIWDDRWKLIRYPQVNVTQLFDLEADPLELHDLAADPDHAKRRQDMMASLAADLKRAGDKAPLVVSNPEPSAISAADLNAKVTRRNRPRINADGPSSRGPKRRDFDFVPGSVSRPADRVDPRRH